MSTNAKRLPPWLRRPWPAGHSFQHTERTLESLHIETICDHANCPNKGECWGRGTATLMLMGSVCTRACKFCSVSTGNPNGWLDPMEPLQVADAVAGKGRL